MSHTPGPWHWDNPGPGCSEHDSFALLDSDGEAVVRAARDGTTQNCFMEMTADDGHLIEAATELLFACKLAWNLVANHMQGAKPTVPPLGDLAEFMDYAEAAIAKTEGTAP